LEGLFAVVLPLLGDIRLDLSVLRFAHTKGPVAVPPAEGAAATDVCLLDPEARVAPRRNTNSGRATRGLKPHGYLQDIAPR
jgi:hypothetical protein